MVTSSPRSLFGKGTSLDWMKLPRALTPTRKKLSSVEVDKEMDVPVVATGSGSEQCSTKLVCDKCDGPHLTNECPYFKKDREKHPDAVKRPGLGRCGLGNTAGNFMLQSSNAKL